MKRTLTFITFLLLFLPVWKNCSNKNVVPADDIEVVDTVDLSCNEVDTVYANGNWYVMDMSPRKTTFDDFLKIFEWDNCQSGYRQVWLGIEFFKREKNEKKSVENEKDTKDEKFNGIEDIFSIFIFFGLLFSFTG